MIMIMFLFWIGRFSVLLEYNSHYSRHISYKSWLLKNTIIYHILLVCECWTYHNMTRKQQKVKGNGKFIVLVLHYGNADIFYLPSSCLAGIISLRVVCSDVKRNKTERNHQLKWISNPSSYASWNFSFGCTHTMRLAHNLLVCKLARNVFSISYWWTRVEDKFTMQFQFHCKGTAQKKRKPQRQKLKINQNN